MSYVSGVTLCTSCCEDDDDDGNSATWSQVNAWLQEQDLQPLARVEKSANGQRSMQQNIGLGGYNGFPHDEFAAFVMAIDWKNPEQVALVILTEDNDVQVWKPREVRGRTVDPHPTLAVRCRRCDAHPGVWCWLPGSTWPLCDERGTPDPDEL